MGGIRFRLWLAAAFLLIGLLALSPPLWLGEAAARSSGRERAERDAAARAAVLALALDRLPPGARRELVESARGRGSARFTLFSPEGGALADSDEDASRMEPHLNRPEVAAALAGQTGTDVRKSATLGREFVYAAVPLADGGAVRSALPLAGVEPFPEAWREGLPGLLLFTLAAGLALGLALVRLLARPLERAAAAAESLAAGSLKRPLPEAGSSETRRLAASLNRLAAEWEARFKRLARRDLEMTAVLENMSEGLVAVAAGGEAAIFNPAARSLLGVGSEAVGRNFAASVRQAELLDLLRDAAASGEALERDLRLTFDPPAGERLAHAHAAPLRDGDGRVWGTLAVLRDVTRLRRLERVRSDFVANVSHELRTPVTSIQGSLEALRDGGLSDGEAAGELLEMALRNARRLGSIIGNLLLLAGMESGGADRDGAAVFAPVEPVLGEALSICREAAEARRVEMTASCEDGLSALMNQRLVAHALVNIIDNAVKYGPEGGVIVVRAFRDGDAARIRITDNGPGIAPSRQTRIFERFYRIDGVRRLREGSGLGLAIAKHVAQSQGGAIELESRPGAGSSFTLSLPARPDAPLGTETGLDKSIPSGYA